MEIRTLKADERESLLELLDGWDLPDGWQGRDFFRRYVEIDPTYEDRNVWVAEKDGRLVSCVQIFPRRMRVLGSAVPTGGIGSVFTAASERHQGIAGRVLERASEAMIDRGMELSILFAGVVPFYAKRGWRSWACQRTVLKPADGGMGGAHGESPAGIEVQPFDWERDFEEVKAIHSAYSASRSGTVVRDEDLWAASFRLAGNPAEEFRVARRSGRVLAYLRATMLSEVFTVTELGRLEDGADALGALVAHALTPRAADPLAPPGKTSQELRSFALLPSFDDIPFTVALEHSGVTTTPLEDPTPMLRCLNAEALAERLDVSLLPGEGADPFLSRILPEGNLVFWPADRF